jgi:mannose-6-phosphate isomerase-like protein (cupin superfamily)
MTTRPIVLHESDSSLESWSDPTRGEVGFRTLFGGPEGTTDSLTAGITEMAPGGWLGVHRHSPAEIYYVLSGHGSVRVGDEEHAVAAGSAVFIPGDLEHGIRNTGREHLRFLYAFPVGSFAEIEYHFATADRGGTQA